MSRFNPEDYAIVIFGTGLGFLCFALAYYIVVAADKGVCF